MQVLVTTFNADQSANTTEAKALTYTFPKKGNAPEGYTLVVNDLESADVATTGGGKYPAYTYFKYNGTSYYLPKSVGALPKGSRITVIAEAPKAPKATPLASIEDRGPEGLADLPPKVEAADAPKAPKAPRATKK